MIIKSYEIDKIDFNKNNLILLYGKNEGLKKQVINKFIKNQSEILSYEEKDILDIHTNFLENILNKSLFEEKKTIIIKRATDKILNIVEEIKNNKIDDKIIIVAENLEKKSKLRSVFEKDKKIICIPFYPDDEKKLLQIAVNFFRESKILISQSNINQIVSKCRGDRANLFNELEKLQYFTKNGKKLNSETISKLINLSENYSILELVDNCLAKNKKKIVSILNENNYTNDDCIIILRAFLNKSKKILKLVNEYENNRDINLTISSAKPPIFWKDKEITKLQIQKWSPKKLKVLIFKVNEIELVIKKNFNNSINLITDFLLEQASLESNN